LVRDVYVASDPWARDLRQGFGAPEKPRAGPDPEPALACSGLGVGRGREEEVWDPRLERCGELTSSLDLQDVFAKFTSFNSLQLIIIMLPSRLAVLDLFYLPLRQMYMNAFLQ
jgi:hypothetical protein